MRLSQPPRLAIVTAFHGEELLTQATESGIDKILMKPVSKRALFEAVGVRQADPAQPPQEARKKNIVESTAALGERHVLVVEDNLLNQELIRYLLVQAGCGVTIADDVEAVFEALRTGTYGLIFMDMRLPSGDGLEVARKIREMPRHARIPIIAMTASDTPEDRQRCTQAGLDGFIAKPIDSMLLEETLQRWLPAPAGRPPASVAASGQEADAGLDESRLIQLCSRLKSLCSNCELDASHLLASNADMFLAAEPNHYQALREALDDIDFDRAQEIIDAIMASRGHGSRAYPGEAT
jgi:two-component system sensor histidine kinase/response regulator